VNVEPKNKDQTLICTKSYFIFALNEKGDVVRLLKQLLYIVENL
jgi:hypothetical protein